MPRPVPIPRSYAHALNEFAVTASMAAEMEDEKLAVGDMVKGLVVAINQQARSKPHPLLYVNLAFLLPVIFSCGVLWQRVNELEAKESHHQSTEGLASKVEAMDAQLSRLTDRMDAFLDSAPAHRPPR